MYTGMLPGYTLAALTDAGHPEAVDAFNAGRIPSSMLWRVLNLEMWLRGVAGEEPLP